MTPAEKYRSNLGLNSGVLPMGYTEEEAHAQFMENLAKLPKQKGITEIERVRLLLAEKARKQSEENLAS
jgi:hypothetical protein